MAKIPLLNQTVEAKSGLQKAPEFASTSGVTEFQRETDRRFEAVKEYGNAVTKLEFMIINRIQEHNTMEDEKAASQLDTQFRMETTSLLENAELDEKGIPKGILNREMENAKGVTIEYMNKYNELKNNYLAKAQNGDQKDALEKSFNNQFQSTYDRVYKHEAAQFNQAYITRMNNNLKQRVLDANGITNPEALNNLIISSQTVSETKDRKLGLPEEAIKYNKELVASEIAKNSITGLIETDINAAQRMFDSVKPNLAKEHQNEIQDILYGKGLEQKAQFRFYALRNKRLPDLSYDYRAAQNAIMHDPSLPEHEKQKMWQSVKGLMAEDEQITHKTNQALDREFMNQVYDAYKAGKPMQETMKLIGQSKSKYGADFQRDSYDKAQKEEIIRKIYTKNVTSDPDIRMNLWKRIQSNVASESEIDNARRRDQISISDWSSLKEDWYTIKIYGMTVEDKHTMETIDHLANRISNTKNKNLFKWEAKEAAKGLPREEAMRKIQEMQEKDPSTGWFGGLIGAKKKYQTSAKQRDADNEAWEKTNLEVGKEVINSIGEGFLNKQDDWGRQDIDKFAAYFGGYDKLKIGTPLNNLIRAMKKVGKPVTIETVERAMAKNKGQFQDQGGR